MDCTNLHLLIPHQIPKFLRNRHLPCFPAACPCRSQIQSHRRSRVPSCRSQIRSSSYSKLIIRQASDLCQDAKYFRSWSEPGPRASWGTVSVQPKVAHRPKRTCCFHMQNHDARMDLVAALVIREEGSWEKIRSKNVGSEVWWWGCAHPHR